MSENTNPFELVAQYRKAKVLATYFISHGVYDIVDEPTEEQRLSVVAPAGLANIPSRAVWTLAKVMMDEYFDAHADAEGKGLAEVVELR